MTERLIKDQNKIPKGFFKRIDAVFEKYPNLYLRLDILLAKIICSNQRMVTALSGYWHDIFPDYEGTENIFENVKKYYFVYRKTAMDILKGEDLSDESYPYYMNLQRLLVRYAFILNLDDSKFTIDSEIAKFIELLKGMNFRRRNLIEEEIELDIVTYFGYRDLYQISEETWNFIKEEQKSVQGIYYILEEIIMKRENMDFSQNIFASKFNTVKIESLLEECLLDLRENVNQYTGVQNKFEKLFEKHWPDLYPNLAFTPHNSMMAYNVIKKDKFLSALRTLIIAGGIKDIRSPRIARYAAYGYTLKYVIVNIGVCRDLDVIYEEVSEMATRINFVGVDQDEESEIIDKLLERYCKVSKSVDEEILEYLMKQKEKIGKVYQIIRDEFNSRFTSKSLEERDKIINELQQQIEYEDLNTLKKVVKYIGDKDFGYILNDLYRVCYGYDPLDEKRVKDSLNGLFYVLGLLGIQPDMVEEVDQVFSESDKLSQKCRYEDNEDEKTGRYIVRYPGWKVMKESVLLPVSMNFQKDE